MDFNVFAGVSERRLENILRFGPKRLQVALGALKNDKLLGMKTKQGVNSKGNRYRMNYYYIKLQNVASVARYKLYKIGKELKAVECGLSWTKSFHCPVCDNKWSGMCFMFQDQIYYSHFSFQDRLKLIDFSFRRRRWRTF